MSERTLKSIEELIKFHGKPKREVYFDGENSGRVLKEVIEAMLPYFRDTGYGHPSITNKPGWEAYEAFSKASELIAKTLNVNSQDLIFTHSGTEANNLAILGGVRANKHLGKKIIISAIEHLSVIFPAKELEKTGFKIVEVPVDSEGFMDPDTLESFVDDDTVLVSIGYVNHEIGTIQRLREIIEKIRDKNPNTIIHSDVVDAYGRIPLDLTKLDLDMATLSSHKIKGPRGVGVLYLKEGVNLEKIIYGQLSTQEYWPGVENVPLVVGFAKAAEIRFTNFEEKVNHMRKLRDMLIEGIMDKVPYVILNGPKGERRAPDNVNLSFLYCEGEALTIEFSFNGVYVSSGSACTTRVLEPSHVLVAIGRKYEEAHGSILFKVDPEHTIEDIEYTLEVVPKAVERIRMISSAKPREV